MLVFNSLIECLSIGSEDASDDGLGRAGAALSGGGLVIDIVQRYSGTQDSCLSVGFLEDTTHWPHHAALK
jgi:hypothetical protein